MAIKYKRAKNPSLQSLIVKSAQILKEARDQANQTKLAEQENQNSQKSSHLPNELKTSDNQPNPNLKQDSTQLANTSPSVSNSLKASATNSVLPIDYQPKNQFQDFQYKIIVHKLGHEHAEVYIYIPCTVNFANKPVLHIFQELFLKYGGALYDRLRDELQWIYSLQAYFRKDLQVCSIYLTCEIRLVKEILMEVQKVFSNWDQYFKPNKFQKLTDIIRKKMDIAEDSLGATTDFMSNMLLTYGIAESYQSYKERLHRVSPEDVRQVYQEIQNNLPRKRIVIVSKNPQIEQISLQEFFN